MIEQTASDQLARDVERCADSHRRLASHLRDVGGFDPAAPSQLPGWTLGHVLTHIARNADGVLRILAGLDQYWLGTTSRAADIELGAGRSSEALVIDVVATSDAVDRALAATTDWSGVARTVSGERPRWRLPEGRCREVEIHLVDLGLGYGFADMHPDFVRSEVKALTMLWAARQPMGLTTLPEAVLGVPEHDRLAWLSGRSTIDGVDPAGVY